MKTASRTRWLALISVTAALAACAEATTPPHPIATTSGDGHRIVLPATGTYTQVSAGDDLTCALRSDGVVVCWEPTKPPLIKTAAAGVFTSVSIMRFHACALRSDGAAECWGSNNDGRAPALVTPPSGTEFVAVEAGGRHSCALTNGGKIQCWGDNDAGQAPASREAATGTYTAISTGNSHTCALNSGGFVECFGSNTLLSVPAMMTATIGIFTKVRTGHILSCGIRFDGVVECFNYLFTLQGEFVDYDAHAQHQCGVNLDGVAQCAGENSDQQAPAMRVAATGSFTQITTGIGHTCALRTDGAIECWGVAGRGAYTTVLPTATFHAPSSVIAGQPIPLSLTNPQVPGFPAATTFTYAFDCGTGFTAASGGSTTSCGTSVTGSRTVAGRIIDQDGTTNTYSATVAIKSTQQSTSDLLGEVQLAPLTPDIRKALLAKLDAALGALAKGKKSAACSALKDFINQVNAQRGKAIVTDTADVWILMAQQIQVAIGC